VLLVRQSQGDACCVLGVGEKQKDGCVCNKGGKALSQRQRASEIECESGLILEKIPGV
jgi:hypothetical protein